jgi:hypothetical protein
MKIIDIRIEVHDDLFDDAWAEAERVVRDFTVWEPDGRKSHRFSVDVFDVSEEQVP